MINIDVSEVERGRFSIYQGQNRTSALPLYDTEIPDNFDIPASAGALIVFMTVYDDTENVKNYEGIGRFAVKIVNDEVPYWE
jgi:hypothetical protein